MNCLRVERLSKKYRTRLGLVKALDRVSFDINNGECFALVGESGSGKSTLAYCLARLKEADGGRVWLKGKDWLALRGKKLRKERARVQLIFQDPFASLNPRMRVRKIIEEPLIVKGVKRTEREEQAGRLLERLDMPEKLWRRWPHELSGGQRQRVAIARALITRPELLIADEPVSALDESTRDQILLLLRELRLEKGLTYLLIAHDLSLVADHCDRVSVMLRGRLVESGTVAAVLQNPRHPYTQFLLAASRLEALPREDERWSTADLRWIGPDHWVAG